MRKHHMKSGIGAGKSFGVKQIAKEALGNDGAVLEFNRLVTTHPALETVIVPLRDGLAICRKRAA